MEKPTRYTGQEHGSRRKDWSSVEARICLAFPDVYDIGMSHLGFRILYKILNDDPRTLAERCYTPWLDLQGELDRRKLPLVSLESAAPLSRFDVVGFSLQYELTYTNILTMLDLGGVALRSSDRDDEAPLVLAGGPVATHAEPMADFLDALLIGDGEEAALEIALTWARAKREGLGRTARLVQLARLRGVYVPSLYATALDPATGLEVVTGPRIDDATGRPFEIPFPIERRVLPNLDAFPFPDDGPVGGPEAIFDRMSIEVARGCTEGCRFCQAGMIYRPVRERNPKQVVATVESALQKSGQDEVSLTALSTADVSAISPLIHDLAKKTAPERVSLGVASLRAYGLGEDLLDDMRQVRASGLTFAPEAGTQRMRDVINKNVTEEQLLETAQRVFSRGFDKMKLYFISGLPTETDEDVLGIIEVGKNALGVGKRLGARPKVTVSVSVHVPKPHTPFQWCAMDSRDEVDHKQALLRSAARDVRGLTLRLHDPRSSFLEGALARGDRRLGGVIERAYRGGARFDSWEGRVDLELWRRAFADESIDVEQYLGTLPVTARLPWDHLDVGLEDGFLAREYRKSLQSRLSPPCGKVKGAFIHHTNVADAGADTHKLVCYDCGIACDLTRMRERRIDFLRDMNALEATEPKRLPVLSTTDQKKLRPEALRPLRPGGPPERWRLSFRKTGPFALLGHLDLLRELPRVVRRAGVRTAYSAGYHPKPVVSFGPALSLGVASLAEWVDVSLIDAPSPEELLCQLNEACAPGMSFTAACRLGPNDPGINRILDGASYVIGLGQAVEEARLNENIATFLAAPEHLVRRVIDGVGKQVDVRAFVIGLAVGGSDVERALAEAGVVGVGRCLEADVRFTQSGAVKVSEVVQAVLGDDFPFVALRVRLTGGGSSPLDLERHRKPGAASVSA